MDFWNAQIPSPKLDPFSLDLEGFDLEIACIIAEETEVEREIRVAADLGPISEAEAAKLAPEPPDSSWGLLGKPANWEPTTVGQARRANIDAIPWEDLLSFGGAHTRAAERSGLDLMALIQFAIDKCNSRHWRALLWYKEWLRKVIEPSMPTAIAYALIEESRHEVASAAAVHQKLRQGGERGGRKSAETRRAKMTLTPSKVLAERDALLEAGEEKNRVVARLARRHSVSTTTIRNKIAEAKRQK